MMKAFRVVAIDDEPLALKLITNHLSKFPQLELIRTFDDAITGAEYLEKHPVDILMIDINMPDITGIDLVKAMSNKPAIIFTTAYKNFAFDGFELEAIDYLLKPIAFDRFAKAVEKALVHLRHKYTDKETSDDNAIFVYSEYRMVRINLSGIEFLESMDDYVKIHLSDGKVVLTLMSLKKMMEKLPAERFQRIHRSYIVALNKIRSIRQRKVMLLNVELPISESYADAVKHLGK